jgi:hypothetical protein
MPDGSMIARPKHPRSNDARGRPTVRWARMHGGQGHLGHEQSRREVTAEPWRVGVSRPQVHRLPHGPRLHPLAASAAIIPSRSQRARVGSSVSEVNHQEARVPSGFINLNSVDNACSRTVSDSLCSHSDEMPLATEECRRNNSSTETAPGSRCSSRSSPYIPSGVRTKGDATNHSLVGRWGLKNDDR